MQDDYGMSPYDYDGGMDAVNEATLNGYHMGDQLSVFDINLCYLYR